VKVEDGEIGENGTNKGQVAVWQVQNLPVGLISNTTDVVR